MRLLSSVVSFGHKVALVDGAPGECVCARVCLFCLLFTKGKWKRWIHVAALGHSGKKSAQQLDLNVRLCFKEGALSRGSLTPTNMPNFPK